LATGCSPTFAINLLKTLSIFDYRRCEQPPVPFGYEASPVGEGREKDRLTT